MLTANTKISLHLSIAFVVYLLNIWLLNALPANIVGVDQTMQICRLIFLLLAYTLLKL